MKGNVKSMTYKGQNYFFWTSVDRRVNFDQEGHWVKFPGEIYETSDKKIDFSSLDLDDGRIECIFDDAGRVVHVEHFSPDGPEIYDYEYDKNGFWSKIKTYYTAYEGDGETKTKEYTIDEVDDHGNWISLKNKETGELIERVISYYEVEAENTESSNNSSDGNFIYNGDEITVNLETVVFRDGEGKIRTVSGNGYVIEKWHDFVVGIFKVPVGEKWILKDFDDINFYYDKERYDYGGVKLQVNGKQMRASEAARKYYFFGGDEVFLFSELIPGDLGNYTKDSNGNYISTKLTVRGKLVFEKLSH